MSEFFFVDAITIDGKPRKTKFGYLLADARVSRTGMQVYSGADVGKPELDQVRILRREAEVFSDEAMASVAHKPITMNHPAEDVTAQNWRTYARGQSEGVVARDGQFLRVPLMLSDAEAISGYEAGVKEISLGYTASLDWSDSGADHDCTMKNIRCNHIAIVPRGRAGSECRIGDSWNVFADAGNPPAPQKEVTTMVDRVVLVDSVPYNMPEQAAHLVERQIKQIKDAADLLTVSQKALADAQTAHTAAISAKDGEIAVLKADKPTAAILDGMVAERHALVAQVVPVLGTAYAFAGKDNATIKADYVSTRMGKEFLAGKDAAFCDAAFATMTHGKPAGTAQAPGFGAPANPLSDHFRAHGAQPVQGISDANPGEAVYQARLNDMRGAWQSEDK